MAVNNEHIDRLVETLNNFCSSHGTGNPYPARKEVAKELQKRELEVRKGFRDGELEIDYAQGAIFETLARRWILDDHRITGISLNTLSTPRVREVIEAEFLDQRKMLERQSGKRFWTQAFIDNTT